MSPELRFGDSGDVINQLTTTLQRLGYLQSPTQIFDSGVEDAVKAFQQSRGLSATGIVDATTSRRLDEAKWKLGDRTLRLDVKSLMRGDDVAQLQTRLVEMGFNCGRVDGIFGPLTEGAIKEFQKSIGVKVDGVCGPGTIIGLMRLMRTVTGGAPTELRAQADREKRGPALADKVIVIDPQSRN